MFSKHKRTHNFKYRFHYKMKGESSSTVQSDSKLQKWLMPKIIGIGSFVEFRKCTAPTHGITPTKLADL